MCILFSFNMPNCCVLLHPKLRWVQFCVSTTRLVNIFIGSCMVELKNDPLCTLAYHLYLNTGDFKCLQFTLVNNVLLFMHLLVHLFVVIILVYSILHAFVSVLASFLVINLYPAWEFHILDYNIEEIFITLLFLFTKSFAHCFEYVHFYLVIFH